MIKRLISFAGLFTLVAMLNINCSKDDDPEPPAAKTKTELITQGSWKFEKATAAGTDISNHSALTCYIDNTLTFSATTATINEGAKACTPPTPSTPFNWSFKNNETIINTTAALIPGGSGDFTIVKLDETNLVISQNVTIPPSPLPVNVVVTFKH